MMESQAPPKVYEPAGGDPCPCERTGRVAAHCCLRDGAWSPAATPTRPPGPRTGLAVPGCYARGLNDCEGGISGEHVLAEGVLDRVLGARFSIVGLPWLERGEIKTNANDKTLKKRVLCVRHNGALSALDEVAIRFAPLREVIAEFRSGQARDSFKLFNGWDVERIILKALCGMLASGMFSFDDTSPGVRSEPPIEWIRTLFGEEELRPSRGLYFGEKPVVGVQEGQTLLRPLCTYNSETRETRVEGLQLAFANIPLILKMHDLPLVRVERDDDFVAFVYRPERLVFSNGRVTKTIHLNWPNGRGDRSLELLWAPGV